MLPTKPSKAMGERLDRIEGGIKTLQWVLGVEIALVGIIVAFSQGILASPE